MAWNQINGFPPKNLEYPSWWKIWMIRLHCTQFPIVTLGSKAIYSHGKGEGQGGAAGALRPLGENGFEKSTKFVAKKSCISVISSRDFEKQWIIIIIIHYKKFTKFWNLSIFVNFSINLWGNKKISTVGRLEFFINKCHF